MAEITLDDRRYRAENFRTNADGLKMADVYYYHPDRGWREVKRWERMLEVAKELWPETEGQVEWKF